MSRLSVFILATVFLTSNQRMIWITEEAEDVSTMPQLPIIKPTLNESFEYTLNCDVVFNFLREEAVGFHFDADIWPVCEWYGFLVPARKKIKMFCENFDIPSADGFCVYDKKFREKRGKKKCYYGKKQEVMIPITEPKEETTFVVKFERLNWGMYPVQNARSILHRKINTFRVSNLVWN